MGPARRALGRLRPEHLRHCPHPLRSTTTTNGIFRQQHPLEFKRLQVVKARRISNGPVRSFLPYGVCASTTNPELRRTRARTDLGYIQLFDVDGLGAPKSISFLLMQCNTRRESVADEARQKSHLCSETGVSKDTTSPKTAQRRHEAQSQRNTTTIDFRYRSASGFAPLFGSVGRTFSLELDFEKRRFKVETARTRCS